MNIAINQSSTAELIRRDSLANLASCSLPETDTQRTLERIWAEALDLDTVGIDDDFFDLGGTSGKAASIFAQIQLRFDSQLPLSSLYNASTVRELGELIEAAAPHNSNAGAGTETRYERLVAMNAGNPNPPLFMIPGSGGNAISLANIVRSLGNDQPVYGLDAKGLDGTSGLLYDQHEIAADHARIIEQQYPGPYYLFGICHGAITAFEVAQILQKKGKVVAFLGLVDPMTVSLPQLKRNKHGTITPLALLKFLTERIRYWRKRHRKQFIRDRLSLPNRRDRLDPQRPARRKLSKANGYAGRRYKPQPYAGPVNLFLTKDCAEGRKKEGRQFWTELLQQPNHTLEYIAGTGPIDLYRADGAPGFAATLRARLKEARAAAQAD
jgi:thioesterase domain-containing protein/acyl carrier protein